MPPLLIDPFHRALYAELMPDLEKRKDGVAHGSAVGLSDSSISTSENYAAQCAYIKALEDVLAKCEELERARYGEKNPLEESGHA